VSLTRKKRLVQFLELKEKFMRQALLLLIVLIAGLPLFAQKTPAIVAKAPVNADSGPGCNLARVGVDCVIRKQTETYYRDLVTLKSGFKITRFYSRLQESDISEGNLTFLREKLRRVNHLRVNFTKPMEESLISIGSSYTFYRPKFNIVYTGKIDDKASGGLSDLLRVPQADILRKFTVSFGGYENISPGVSGWRIGRQSELRLDRSLGRIWSGRPGTC
jgi:outer membrane lipoprotein-sorting protein